MNSPSEVKARASKLRDVLTGMGYQLKYTESLEAISKIEGYADWNTFTANLTKKQKNAERYPLVFTEAAALKVKELIEEEGNPDLMFRVFVSGSDGSKFQHGITFDDTINEGDTEIKKEGVKLLIDPVSFQYLTRAEVDCTEGLVGSNFVIRNPNATIPPTEVEVRASKLRDVLADMGHQLKHNESLEVISKIEGYPDWNTHTADITEQQQAAEQYLDDKKTEIASTSPDHPIIDAIKSDNEALLRESLTDEVLSNKIVMSEAFYQSVVLDRVSLAEVLIEQGADVRSVVIRQVSLFEFLIHIQREDYLKMLVFKFKKLKGIHPKSSKILPLAISVLDKNDDALEFVKILLDQGANINAQISEGETALLMAGMSANNLDLVALLVERGADVNLSNENGCTPLMDAAELGKNDILRYLLKNGADINAKKINGISALDLARNTENSHAIEMLVSKIENIK